MRKPIKNRRLEIKGRETYSALPLERELDLAYNAEIRIEANSPMIFEDENMDPDGNYTVKDEYNIRTDKLESLAKGVDLAMLNFEKESSKKREEAKNKADELKAAKEAEM